MKLVSLHVNYIFKYSCFFQVTIVGSCGVGARGDIAIDDILLKAGACSKCYFIIAIILIIQEILPNKYYAYNRQKIISFLCNVERLP